MKISQQSLKWERKCMKQENIPSDPPFEQIVPQYRGKTSGWEAVLYVFTIVLQNKTNTLSGYQFENFVSSYPKEKL
jgi:hypothetical protein